MISPILEMKESEVQRGEVFCSRSPSNLVSDLEFESWLRNRKHFFLLLLLPMDPRGWMGELPFYYR